MTQSSKELPLAILIGGSNGAGKTTFARQLLPTLPPVMFLNADEIQKSSSSFDHPVSAGKELLLRLGEAAAKRRSFAVETTLSSLRYARLAEDWKAAGYAVLLHFVELPSADIAVERVRQRVAAGGHGIPEADIRRRFTRGRENFATHYQAVVDSWYHWSNENASFQLIAAG